jgi:deoxyadenosine/deoxycytidine kinase
LPKPDLILYLYTSIPKLKGNILSRGREYEKEIKADYLENIQRGYLSHFRTLKGIRILIVDTGERDFVKNEEDYLQLCTLLEREYTQGIHHFSI